MGALLSLFGGIKKKDTRVLLLGLDNAGKTTIIKQLGLMKMYTASQMAKEDEEDMDPTDTVPTVGFNVKEIQYKNLKFAVWDLGGQASIRSLWQHYYKGTNGIIYVVDSSAHQRVEESRKQLENLISEPELKGVPLLIFANKNDVKGAATTAELTDKFKLNELVKERKFVVQSCCAINGDGLRQGLEWLVELLK